MKQNDTVELFRNVTNLNFVKCFSKFNEKNSHRSFSRILQDSLKNFCGTKFSLKIIGAILQEILRMESLKYFYKFFHPKKSLQDFTQRRNIRDLSENLPAIIEECFYFNQIEKLKETA